jgi:hypothetical protein
MYQFWKVFQLQSEFILISQNQYQQIFETEFLPEQLRVHETCACSKLTIYFQKI